MATASTRTLLGTVLSQRWRLVQRLGDGGMGEVYAADAVAGGARVAVKVLRSEFVADPLVRARFADEGRACMRLVHPNIVQVMECGVADDQSPYMVMELLEGVPLGAYTQNGGRVPAAQAVPILQGILAGLGAAHGQGLVHRDLKPDNVFLTRQTSGTFVVKLLDFGIAKVMDAAGGMATRTRSGMLLGTAAYMSPEQVKNASDVDQRADLWSAGVMLYEMLTGRVAFPAPTEYARLAAVLTTDPEPIERVDPALGPFAPCVARALKKNRDERFASALDMARALAAVGLREPSRAEGVPGSVPPTAAAPLSRLPDVPSMFAPSAGAVPIAFSAVADTAPAGGGEIPASGKRRSGSTLASAEAPSPIIETPPQVSILPQALDGTLPSKDLPKVLGRAIRAARGVSPFLVVGLVVLALAAGLLLGWVFARMT